MSEREPVLFLPGLLCDRSLYTHQLAHLTDVCDPRFAGVPAQSTMAEMAAEVLASAPQRFGIVGLSMGGYLAFELLRKAPDRITRLALLNTRADPDPAERMALRENLARRAETGDFDGIPSLHVASFIAQHRLAEPGFAGAVTAMGHRVGPIRYAAQQRAIAARPDSRPLLEHVLVPTLVIAGRLDELTPIEGHRSIAHSIPGARLAIVEGSGHLCPLEAPQAITALLRDWLVYHR